MGTLTRDHLRFVLNRLYSEGVYLSYNWYALSFLKYHNLQGKREAIFLLAARCIDDRFYHKWAPFVLTYLQHFDLSITANRKSHGGHSEICNESTASVTKSNCDLRWSWIYIVAEPDLLRCILSIFHEILPNN